jgi:hypothetical protein
MPRHFLRLKKSWRSFRKEDKMADKKYVLMKWKDEWQEVMSIESDAVDFNRYYVIERVEHFGRLVINRPEREYPSVIAIDRAPMEIEKIILINGKDERNLKQASIYREGSRLEYHYDLQKGGGNFIEEIKNSINEVLSKKSISAREILSKPDFEKIKEIENIGRVINLVGSRKQEDVVGFIELLLGRMGETKAP